MSVPTTLARVERLLRPLLHRLPPHLATKAFSKGRSVYTAMLANDVPADRPVAVPPTTVWGMKLRTPLWNAAGMFKKGEGYAMVAAQGAGMWLAGTTTSRPRAGNTKNGIQWPAVPYPASGAAHNWMGLPNEGHAVVAERIARLDRRADCAVGISLSAEPGLEETVALHELADGMRRYIDAGVDYIEMNESCPNVPGHAGGPVLDDGLVRRLEYVMQHVLHGAARRVPVVVKFSNDTAIEQMDNLVATLVQMGYDGIVLGNTSTRYDLIEPQIAASERRTFRAFVEQYGGGVSGRPLKAWSLALCAAAVHAARNHAGSKEFHVVRCGGIESMADIEASAAIGVQLNQWYTGYFTGVGKYGHDVYGRVLG